MALSFETTERERERACVLDEGSIGQAQMINFRIPWDHFFFGREMRLPTCAPKISLPINRHVIRYGDPRIAAVKLNAESLWDD